MITKDADNNGYISAAEKGKDITTSVTVKVPADAKDGDVITVTSGTTTLATFTVGQKGVTAGSTQTVDKVALPAHGQTLQVKATITNAAGTKEGSDRAVMDLAAGVGNTIKITAISEDTGTKGDFKTTDNTLMISGTLGKALEADESVEVSLNGGQSFVKATVNGTTWTLDATGTALNIGSHNVVARIIDTHRQVGPEATQAVVIERAITAPKSAPEVVIVKDADNNGVISLAEKGKDTTTNVTVKIPADAQNGDVITITSGTTTLATFTVGQNGVTAGSTQTVEKVALPTDGKALTIKAVISNAAGSKEATDTATVEMVVAPKSAPEVVITKDADNNGYISAAEKGKDTTTSVTVKVPADAKDGDVITVTSGTTTLATFTVGQNGVTAGSTQTVTGVALPADGASLNVTATITNAAGSKEAADSARLDATAPEVTTLNVAKDGKTISGTTEAGAKVVITLPDGKTVETTADKDGNFSVSLTNPVEPNKAITAVATDAAGNPSQPKETSYALNAPASAPEVVITKDADNNGYISAAEKGKDITTSVTVKVPADAKDGDVITVTSGTTTLATFTVGQKGVTAGSTQTVDKVALPAHGQTLQVKATITNAAGTKEGSDRAVMDLAAGVGNTIKITAISEDTGTKGDFKTTDNTLMISGTLGKALEADESVEVSLNGGQSFVKATVNGTTWTLDATGTALNIGSHNVVARIIDTHRQVGPEATQAVVIERAGTAPATAPVVAIRADTNNDGYINAIEAKTGKTDIVIRVPADAKNGDVITITDGSGKTLGSITVGQNNVAAGQTTIVKDIPLPANGKTLEVKATISNAAGSKTGAVDRAVIDTVVTQDHNIKVTSISEDTGTKGDFKTTDKTLVISGTIDKTLASDETIEVSLNGGQSFVKATVNGTTWTLDATKTTLEVGTHNIVARVIDNARNIGSETTQTLEIENAGTAPATAPTVAIMADKNNDGLLNTTEVNSGEKRILIRVPSDAKNGDVITLTDAQGQVLGKITVGQNGVTAGSNQYINNVNIPANGQTLDVKATITNGYGSLTGASDKAVVDTSVGVGNGIRVAYIENDTGTKGDFKTTDNTLVIHGTLTKNLAADEIVQVSLDGGKTFVKAVTTGTSWKLDATGTALTVGTHNVIARIIDKAQNVGPETKQAIVIESNAVAPSSAPIILITKDLNDDGYIDRSERGTSTKAILNIVIPRDAKIGDVVTVKDDSTGEVLATYTVDKGEYAAGTTQVAHVSIPGEGGTIRVSASITNASGVTLTGTDTAIIDTKVAEGNSITIESIHNDTGLVGTDFITNDQTLEFSGKLGRALAADEKVQISVDNGLTYMDAVTTGTTWKLDYTGTTMTEGTHHVIARITDRAGNSSETAIAKQDVVIDLTAQANRIDITRITTDTGRFANNNDFVTSDSTLIFYGNVHRLLLPDERVQVSINNGEWVTVTKVAGTIWTYDALDNQANAFAQGVHNIRARIVDLAGNQAADYIKPTVLAESERKFTIDTVAPTAPAVKLLLDADNDGILTTKEKGTATKSKVEIEVPRDAVAGDVIVVSNHSTGAAGDEIARYTVGENGVTPGKVITLEVDLPKEGTLNVQADVIDVAGNHGIGNDFFVMEGSSGASQTINFDNIGNGQTVNLGTGDDVLNFTGNNQTIGGGNTHSISGGAGHDTLMVSGTGNSLSLSDVFSFETIDLGDAVAGNTLFSGTVADVKAAIDKQNGQSTIYVKGDANDTVDLGAKGASLTDQNGATWTKGAAKEVDGVVYDAWTAEDQTLYIEQGINVI